MACNSVDSHFYYILSFIIILILKVNFIASVKVATICRNRRFYNHCWRLVVLRYVNLIMFFFHHLQNLTYSLLLFEFQSLSIRRKHKIETDFYLSHTVCTLFKINKQTFYSLLWSRNFRKKLRVTKNTLHRHIMKSLLRMVTF